MLRDQILEAMGALRLHGMKSSLDEVLAAGIKQKKTSEKILLELLSAELAERRVRSIRYRMGLAKFPMDKDLDSFDFNASPVNEALVRSLYEGRFLSDQGNVILVGGTGTGKSHLAIAIARHAVRSGMRGRFFNLLDLVNQLEQESWPTAAEGWPRAWPASTSWCWTNWGTCRSRKTAASCCSI